MIHKALVPASVEAQSLLADALVSALLERRAASAAADIARAESLTGCALLAAPRNPLAHYARGQVLRVQGRPEEAAYSRWGGGVGCLARWSSSARWRVTSKMP
jgi:hypothetical protein